MHVCVLFYNLGGYHLARLQAAKKACDDCNWEFSSIQIAGSTSEHPWGDMALPAYVTTLSSFQGGNQPSFANQALLLNALSKLSPDAVAIPGWGFDFARTALKWCGIHQKTKILMSESKYDDEPRSWLKEIAKRWLAVSRFDAAIVGGKKHEDYLIGLGMQRDKIFRGYDVIDNDHFRTGAERFRRFGPNEAPECVRGRNYLLSANRFIARKNLPRLIDAFALASKSPSAEQWDLVLLGGGEQEHELRQRASDAELAGRIHFPGFVSYCEIPRWYAFANAFIHPALSEQWGLVVNEALASGLPVLLSEACGCHPELLSEGNNGFAFNPEDTVQMAKAIERVMNGLEGSRAASHDIIEHFAADEFGIGLVSAVNAASKEQQ